MWTDETLMPWGKHKGTPLGEVPADYLIELTRTPAFDLEHSCPQLAAYIKRNKAVLHQQCTEDEETKGYATFEDYLEEWQHGF